MDNDKFILEMKNISMVFPGVKALSDVDFQIESGQVYALVGANGAGKSTLMKVLSGVNNTYTGGIYFNGEQIAIRSPIQSKKLGIEIVYQEVDTALIPTLSVAENIMFNTIVAKMKANSLINWRKIRKEAKEALDDINVNIDVNKLVSSLTLAQKQMTLITKAVRENCKILILDEPTAPLSYSETNELFALVKRLMANNVMSIVFITHRLQEIFQICSKVVVMRDGTNVGKFDVTDELRLNAIVDLMLGRSFEENYIRQFHKIGDIMFEAQNVSDMDGKVNGVTFNIRQGEVVGISGLVGAGKTELSKLLFGAETMKTGSVRLNGKELVMKLPTDAVKNKLGLVPEERRKEGVMVSEPVYFNLSAACLKKFCNKMSFVIRREENKNAQKQIKALNIRTSSINQKVESLSGGNQQKVVVGKWLAAECEVYIMDEPTKGVDVGAKREIYQLIHRLAGEGKAILYMTSEISEILSVTDRTFIMFDGKLIKEFETSKTNENEILYYAIGGN